MSRSGQAARFDRVLLRAPTQAIAPIEVVRFADRPIGERHGESQFASDHFGLCALLQLGPAAVSPAAAPIDAAPIDAAPVHRSALVVIPPEAVWAPIQAIRAAHDPAYARWMPHINLIYGFIPEARFAEAVTRIEPLLRTHPPIRLRLGELRRFDHRGSTTVWLAPICDPPAALVALQQALAPLFPACVEQAGRASAGFTPHLTVAKLSGSEAEIAATVAQWQARWRPLACTIDALHLISRRDEEPFAIRHSLPLGATPSRPDERPTSTTNRPTTAPTRTPERPTTQPTPPSPLAASPGVVAPPPWTELPSPRHLAAAQAIAAACRELLGDACLHIVGSARLGVATPDSDLDLVCAGPSTLDRTELFTGLRERLGDHITAVREATSAGLPVLRMRLGELAVDLQYAGLPASLSAARLASLTPDELAGLDDPSRRAALTCLDADAVPAFVDGRLEVPVFLAMLRRVRAWARARALDVGAWGLLGGYSWALLAAFAARDAARQGVPSDPDALLRHFFAVFAVWEPGRPVALGPLPAIAPTRRAPWPIYTPTPPPFNSARGLTRSTYTLVRHELRRADAIVRASGDDLCAAIDPAADPRRLVLSLSGVDLDGELACRGWLDGHVLRLLLALEDRSARVRPYPRPTRDADPHQSIGLIGGPARELLAAAHDFCLDFAMWPERPAGATLPAELITT